MVYTLDRPESFTWRDMQILRALSIRGADSELWGRAVRFLEGYTQGDYANRYVELGGILTRPLELQL